MTTPIQNEPDDEHIVGLIGTDSNEGLRLLLDQHAPGVNGRLVKKYGENRSQDIEDAIFEAAYTVHERIDEFDRSKGPLFGWFYVIAHNNLRQVLRREAVRPLLLSLQGDGLDLAAPRARSAETTSQTTMRLLDNLKTCIGKLSPMRQFIILTGLAECDDVDDREIANRFNTTVSVIRSSRHEARKRLARLLRRSVK